MSEAVYGFFCGGDPRNFTPDEDMCAPEEIARHAEACRLWDEAAKHGREPVPEDCPSGWIYDTDRKPIGHVLRAPYGIGVTYYPDDVPAKGGRP